MNQSINSSLNKIRLIESQSLAEAPAIAAPATAAARDVAGVGQLGAMGAAKIGSKLASKLVPGLGAVTGAASAANRYQQGDKTGAAIAGLTGAASTIPVVGTGAALAGMGIQAIRDKMRTGSWLPDDEEIAAAAAKDQASAGAQPVAAAKPEVQVPQGGDPKVFALQQQLIAKGAKISADGKMGPATQAAMKQFPGVQLASKVNRVKGTIMSESEKIATLRARLEQIENQQVNEGPLDALARFGKGVAAGIKNPNAFRTAGGASAIKPGTQGAGAFKTGQAVARNPGKTAAAVGAAGAAAGYMAGKPGAAGAPVGGKPAVKPAAAPAQTANAGPDPKEVEELNKLANDLQNSQDPIDIELMQQYNGIINAINNRAKDDKRTQGEIAASAALGDAG